jgi:hypothetical protein
MSVTVVDDEAPEITCPTDITVDTDLDVCEAFVTVPAITNVDECGILSIVNDFTGTSDASGVYPIGTTTVVWTVTDIHNNVSTCSMTVTVVDNQDPYVTCPADQFVSADNNCEFTMADYTALVISSDNCDLALDIVQSPAPGTIVAGTSTVTMTVTDDAGNVTTCTFSVIVEDNTAPTIVTCAPDVTEQVNAGCDFSIPSYTALVNAFDNCDNDLTYTQDPIAGTIISGFATTQLVTITVTDDNNNSTQCTFVITLDDSINPSITCPANLTVNNDLDACSALVTVPCTNCR